MHVKFEYPPKQASLLLTHSKIAAVYVFSLQYPGSISIINSPLQVA